MLHFRCSVEWIKRFLNIHLHCIVGNVPNNVRKYSGPPELLCSEISFSHPWNIPKQWKLHRQQGAVWMKCVLCSYFYKIVYLICNSQKFVIHWKLHLLSPKISILTKNKYLFSAKFILQGTLVVSNLKMINKMLTSPPGRISADAHEWSCYLAAFTHYELFVSFRCKLNRIHTLLVIISSTLSAITNVMHKLLRVLQTIPNGN